jgi:lipoprotein-anchoring transpeptidase ErfK/SrfK
MKKRNTIWLASLFIILGMIVYYFYPEQQLKDGQKSDKIVVNKADHQLLLYYKDEVIASYSVSLSKKGLAKKTIKGDNLTPEGSFKAKKGLATKFHKAIGVGEWEDCCLVRIHGQEYGWAGKFNRWVDWTEGCIALTNDEIDEIYGAVNNGVVIEINP